MTAESWFETHAHLADAQFDSDRDSMLERAFQQGVHRIIEIADGPEEWEKARALSERFAGQMWWAAGLHPYFADQANSEVLLKLKSFASHPQFVAVGEVGLDYAKCPISHEKQMESFNLTLDLAQSIQKPLIIHCREAYADLLLILQSRFQKDDGLTPSPGVIHCFSGTAEEGKILIGMGFYLGVDAPITYPKAHQLREAIQILPIEKLVIETDSPYLPPQPYRGKRNEPAYLPLVGEKLAEIKKMPRIEVSTILRQNSDALFRLKSLSI